MWYIAIDFGLRVGLPIVIGITDFFVSGAPFSALADIGLTVTYDSKPMTPQIRE